MDRLKKVDENMFSDVWKQDYRAKMCIRDSPKALNGGNYSSQPWIEIRYAEVLLNRAEAAWELVSLGEVADAKGESYLSIATEAINSIRKRAGATELSSTLLADEKSRDRCV